MRKLCPQGHTYSGRACKECMQPKRQGTYKYGWKWDCLSRRYRTLFPLCEDCEDRGRITPSSEVHHIVPISEDESKKYEWSNLVALCHGCHRSRHN